MTLRENLYPENLTIIRCRTMDRFARLLTGRCLLSVRWEISTHVLQMISSNAVLCLSVMILLPLPLGEPWKSS